MTARNLTLFDLDGTLIPGDSDHSFGEFMVDIGWADGEAWRRRNDEFYATYVAGALDVHKYVAFATSVWRGRTAQEWRDVLATRLLIENHCTASAITSGRGPAVALALVALLAALGPALRAALANPTEALRLE